LSHHRADDLPAYLVIVVVGHIIVPIALMDRNQLRAVDAGAAGVLSAPSRLESSLLLLQPVKGAVVGLQWAFRMHGFDESRPEDVEAKARLRSSTW
jgi:uncharacterized protein (DUF983 family)